jgi:hypothetical protein
MRHHFQHSAWWDDERGNLHRVWNWTQGFAVSRANFGRAKDFPLDVAGGHAYGDLANCSRGACGFGGIAQVKDVTPNNALERQQIDGGRAVLAMDCVLAGAEWAPWWAAQQDR